MKIYVITKGSYSDYHIITATTDETQARKIADKFSDDYEKAEIEIYEDAKLYLKAVWFVRFDTKGNVNELHEDNSEYSYQYVNECGFDCAKGVYVHVQADDEISAIKIAAEKRAMFLAKKAGVV